MIGSRHSVTSMNDLYFRCEDCKRFVDAGYRWAYVTLVRPGVVVEDDFADGGSNLPVISAAAVLAAHDYWQESDGDERARAALASQLARVKAFLEAHQRHRLSFGDLHRFHRPEDEWLNWLSEDDAPLLPRNLVEVLGCSDWSQVEAAVAGRTPWWWGGKNMAAARRRFDDLVRAKRG
jgi:hypothetical protein